MLGRVKKAIIKKGFFLGKKTNNQAEYLALEFDDTDEDSDLAAIRPARTGEFPELSASKAMSKLETVELYVTQVGKATTSQIAQETGMDVGNVSRLLNKSGKFVVIEKKGREVYYGVSL